MRLTRLIYLLSVLISVSFGMRAQSQSDILVTGKVSNRVDKGPMAGVSIYIFKTVGDGVYEYKRAEQMYETGYVPEGLIREVMSQQDGMYEATLPSGGSLLFYKHPYKPVLVKVRGRNRHDVVIEGTRELKEAVLVEQGRKMTKKGKAVSYGDKFTVKDFPYFLDKTKMPRSKRNEASVFRPKRLAVLRTHTGWK